MIKTLKNKSISAQPLTFKCNFQDFNNNFQTNDRIYLDALDTPFQLKTSNSTEISSEKRTPKTSHHFIPQFSDQ